MRSFKIPFNIQAEDKVIGGYLSIRQLLWLFVGLGVVLALFVMDRGYLQYNKQGQMTVSALQVVIRLMIALVFVVLSIYMAFVRMREMNADKYTFKMLRYKCRNNLIKYDELSKN